MNKMIASIISVCTVIGLAFSIYFYMDSRYALASDLEKTNQRLEYKITADQVNETQNRLWKLDDRYDTVAQMPESVKEEYRDLKERNEQLKNKLKGMEKAQ